MDFCPDQYGIQYHRVDGPWCFDIEESTACLIEVHLRNFIPSVTLTVVKISESFDTTPTWNVANNF